MPFDPVLNDAQSTSTLAARLAELSEHRLIGIRIEVGRNPSTPQPVLRLMSENVSPRIRLAVADNPALPDDLVLKLASDPIPVVRLGAAWNAAGRAGVTATLSRSPDPDVRALIAHQNGLEGSLPREIQVTLASDSYPRVRQIVATSTPYRDLYDALLHDPDPRVRGHCGGNPRATRIDFEVLLADRSATTRAIAVVLGAIFPDDAQLVARARDRSANVRWAVIMRVGCPRDALDIVEREDDEMNSHQAKVVIAGGSHAPQVIEQVLAERKLASAVGDFV